MKIEIHLNEHEEFTPMLFANTLINQRLENIYNNQTELKTEVKWIEQLSEHLAVWIKYAKEIINE